MENGIILQRSISRRKFIAASAATGAALSLGAICDPALIRRMQQEKIAASPHHRVWLWQFNTDGAPEDVADRLSGTGIGVLVKTHDGVDWMSRYDRSADAISGPQQIERIANIFERANVPFHVWSVVKGVDPFREAEMTADALNAGARSLTLDLEGGAGFWHGTPDDALRFGDELRRRTPIGRVDISIDPRPWRINHVPMPEFVAFTDGIWPQLYWETFSSQGNYTGYTNAGYPVGPGGMTPEFLLETTQELLEPYDREIIPVGQGAAADIDAWPQFVRRAWELGMGSVSVWRYGVTRSETVDYLDDNPAGTAPQLPKRTPTPRATSTKTVKPTRTPTKTRTSTASPTRTPTKTRTPTRTPTPDVTPEPTP